MKASVRPPQKLGYGGQDPECSCTYNRWGHLLLWDGQCRLHPLNAA